MRKSSRHPAQQRFFNSDLIKGYEGSDVYLSYTEIEKLGINPRSQHRTPIGIYAYQMSAVSARIMREDTLQAVPYQGVVPYVWILSAKAPVLVLDEYTFTQYQLDLGKLINHYGARKILSVEIKAKSSAYEKPNMAASNLWNLTRLLSKDDRGEIQPAKWNYILRKVLGYEIIRDNGMGLIHSNEPAQTVFLSIKSVEILKQLQNRKLDLWKVRHSSRVPPSILKRFEKWMGNHITPDFAARILTTNHYRGPRYQELMENVLRCPMACFTYSNYSKKPFPEGEGIMAEHAACSAQYAMHVLGKRFEKGEKAIQASAYWRKRYEAVFPESMDLTALPLTEAPVETSPEMDHKVKFWDFPFPCPSNSKIKLLDNPIKFDYYFNDPSIKEPKEKLDGNVFKSIIKKKVIKTEANLDTIYLTEDEVPL